MQLSVTSLIYWRELGPKMFENGCHRYLLILSNGYYNPAVQAGPKETNEMLRFTLDSKEHPCLQVSTFV